MTTILGRAAWLAAALTAAAFPATAQTAAPAATARETVVPAFAYALPNAPGKTMSALLVSYPPGASTPPHRHGQAFVVAYVLEGSIRSRLGNGEAKVYKAGESWSEPPGAHHTLGENASTTEPAKLLAIFVAKTGAKDLFVLDAAAEPKPTPKK